MFRTAPLRLICLVSVKFPKPLFLFMFQKFQLFISRFSEFFFFCLQGGVCYFRIYVETDLSAASSYFTSVMKMSSIRGHRTRQTFGCFFIFPACDTVLSVAFFRTEPLLLEIPLHRKQNCPIFLQLLKLITVGLNRDRYLFYWHFLFI